MAPVQTSYDTVHAPAYSGQVANEVGRDIVSKVVNETGGILPGRAVVLDGATKKIKYPTGAGDSLMGIVARTLEHEVGTAQVVIIPDKMEAPVLEAGNIWVEVEDAVVIDGSGFYRHTGGNEGMIRSDVDGGNAKIIDGSRFLSAAGAGGIAHLFIPYSAV